MFNMKSFKLPFLGIVLALMCFQGCEKPEPNSGQEISFRMTDENIASTAISVTVNPTPDNAEWYADLVATASIAGSSDDDIVKALVTKDLLKGKQTLSFDNLEANTEYTLLTVGYADDKAGKLYKTNYTTPAPEKFNAEIAVSAVTFNTATVKITPNKESVTYYYNLFPKSEVSRNGQLIAGEELIAYWKYADKNISSKLYTGSKTFNHEGLASDIPYVCVVFEYDQDIEMFTKEFTTEKNPDIAHFTIAEITPGTNNVTFTVTPDDLDKYYCCYITPKKHYDQWSDKSTWVQGCYNGLNNTGADKGIAMNDYIKQIAKKGVAQWDNSMIFRNGDLETETEYVITVFYVNPDNIDPFTVYDYSHVTANFTTLASKVELSIEIGEIFNITNNGNGTASLTVHLKSSEASKYRIGAQPKANFDADYAKNPNSSTWSNFYFSWTAKSDVEGMNSPEGADYEAMVAMNNGPGEYYLVVRVHSEDGKTAEAWKLFTIN